MASGSDGTDRLSAWIRLFRWMAVAEAVTWVLLIVGMYVKYVAHGSPVWSTAFGYVHGLTMVFYVMACGVIRPDMRWTGKQTLIAIASSVPPLTTLPFERWAMRRYRALPPELRVTPKGAPLDQASSSSIQRSG